MSEVIGGVDEAGRGPVIGPLVVAGVAILRDKEGLLRGHVRDSKALSPARRRGLFPLIKKLSEKVVVEVVPPEVVDHWILSYKGGLNLLEVEIFSRVISKLEADIVYIDSCDVKPERLSSRIRSKLGRKAPRIVCETKADVKYPVVSAASVVAKVIRDREIERIRREYGDIGSGYPSDRRTIEFIRSYYEESGELPPIVRRSYKTIKRIIGHPKKILRHNYHD